MSSLQLARIQIVPASGISSKLSPWGLREESRFSHTWWEDENGTTQIIPQGEGGEQGDALMPLLFAVGQHAALVAAQGRLQQDERIFAFLDDIYTTSSPDRVGAVYAILQEELHHIRIHTGKTQVWNQGGVRPSLRCIGVDCTQRTS